MTITTKLAASVLCLVAFPSALLSQVMTPATPQSGFPKEAYVFEILHTHVRFEADGTGSREMTGRIRVQSEAATHELGLLRFSYASTFESLNDLSAMRAYRVGGIKEWGGAYKTATFGIALREEPEAPFVWVPEWSRRIEK